MAGSGRSLLGVCEGPRHSSPSSKNTGKVQGNACSQQHKEERFCFSNKQGETSTGTEGSCHKALCSGGGWVHGPYQGGALLWGGQGARPEKGHGAERKLPRDRRSSCRACLALHLLPSETRWTDPRPDVGSPVYTTLKRSPQCPRSSPLTWSVGQPRAYGLWPPCEKDPEPLVCTSGTGRSKSFRSYKVEAPWLCGAHLDTLGASLKDPPAPV